MHNFDDTEDGNLVNLYTEYDKTFPMLFWTAFFYKQRNKLLDRIVSNKRLSWGLSLL